MGAAISLDACQAEHCCREDHPSELVFGREDISPGSDRGYSIPLCRLQDDSEDDEDGSDYDGPLDSARSRRAQSAWAHQSRQYAAQADAGLPLPWATLPGAGSASMPALMQAWGAVEAAQAAPAVAPAVHSVFPSSSCAPHQSRPEPTVQAPAPAAVASAPTLPALLGSRAQYQIEVEVEVRGRQAQLSHQTSLQRLSSGSPPPLPAKPAAAHQHPQSHSLPQWQQLQQQQPAKQQWEGSRQRFASPPPQQQPQPQPQPQPQLQPQPQQPQADTLQPRGRARPHVPSLPLEPRQGGPQPDASQAAPRLPSSRISAAAAAPKSKDTPRRHSTPAPPAQTAQVAPTPPARGFSERALQRLGLEGIKEPSPVFRGGSAMSRRKTGNAGATTGSVALRPHLLPSPRERMRMREHTYPEEDYYAGFEEGTTYKIMPLVMLSDD